MNLSKFSGEERLQYAASGIKGRKVKLYILIKKNAKVKIIVAVIFDFSLNFKLD